MVCDGATINLKVNARGDYRPAWKALKVSLPAGENVQLLVNGLKGASGWSSAA
jgi:alpha-glucosidase